MIRSHRSRRFRFVIRSAVSALLGVGLFIVSPASGQEADWTNDLPGEDDDQARESQNPVGNLINLRFENNSNFNTGPQDSYQNVFNIIPVYPALARTSISAASLSRPDSRRRVA